VTALLIAAGWAAILAGGCGDAGRAEPDPRWCASINRWTDHRLAVWSDPLESFSSANEELDVLRDLPQPGLIRQDMEIFLGIDESVENRGAGRREAFRLDRIGRYVRATCPQITEAQVRVFGWSDAALVDD
jgi:hypothetical protein